jgi:hypothetical protein
VVIPDGATTIGERAFKDCYKLDNVVIPASVTKIGEQAFYTCKCLQSVVILGNYKTVDYEAFYMCPNITSIAIGKEVSIDKSGLEKCHDFGKAYADANRVAGTYKWSDGKWDDKGKRIEGNWCLATTNNLGILEIGKETYKGHADLNHFIIPDGVAVIGESAFRECTNLESVVIPNSVTSIDHNAFDYCTSLKSVVIPDSVKTIEPWAFNGCFALQSVDLGRGVESIGDGAFFNACGWSEITIPSSVTYIGDHSFWCGGANDAQGKNKTFKKVNFGNPGDTHYKGVQKAESPNWGGFKELKEIYYNGERLPSNLFAANRSYDTVTLGPNVREVQENAFYGLTIKQLNLSDGIQTINSNAFTWMWGLKTVRIPNTVTKISDWAFNGCFDLKNLTIGNNVTYIGNGAFYNTSIEDLTIPDKVETIGGKAFSNGANRIKVVRFGGGLKHTNIDGHNIFENSTKNLNDVWMAANLPNVGISSYFEDCYQQNGRTAGWYKWTKKKGWKKQ